jgi:TetR/AcrR family transcriptional regulator
VTTPAAPRPAGRRGGRQPADVARRTRGAILDAALALFAARGFDGVSLRDIADAAGTTHGLVRHHFGAKQDVWRAVVAEADARYVAALPADLADPAEGPRRDPSAALAHLVTGLVLATWQHPEVARLLVHEGAQGGERLTHVLGHLAPLRRLSAPLLERLHAEGHLAGYDVDGFVLLLLGVAALPFALAPLAAAVGGVDMAREADVRRHAQRVADLLLRR